MTIPRLLPVALAAVFLTGASAATASAVDLDLRGPAGSLFVGPVTTGVVPDGARQVAIVQGTMSLWSVDNWSSSRNAVCGAPESAPLFATPGVLNGPAGVDAETRFGPLAIKSKSDCAKELGRPSNFVISTGGAYAHPAPLSGSTPANHTYLYPLVGSGQAANYRFYDPAASDNYGVFHITTRDADDGDCAGDGAAELGYPTTADCTAALPPAPAVTTTAASTSGIPPVVSPLLGATADSVSNGVCGSRRRFTIRIKESRHQKLRSAKVYLAGKKVATAKRRKTDHRLVATINFVKRPKSTFTIQIKAVTRAGHHIASVRKYKTCTKRGTAVNAKSRL